MNLAEIKNLLENKWLCSYEEDECLEFKEAKNDFDKDKFGKKLNILKSEDINT